MTSAYQSLGREWGAFALARPGAGRRLAIALIKWTLVALVGIHGISASAQVIDQIELHPDSNGEKEIVLKFVSDVVLARYSPEREGRTIRLYIGLVGVPQAIANLPREERTGPIIAGVPRFTVSFPEQDGSLALSFSAPVKFRVRQVRGSRTISVFVQARPGAEQGQGESSVGTRAQVFEPKAVAAIPDVIYPPPATPSANAAASAVPAIVATVPPAPRSYEPKAVPSIPDVVIGSAASSPPAAAAASTQAITTAAKPPEPAAGVATGRSFEPKPVPGIPDVIITPAPVPTVVAGSPSSTATAQAMTAPPQGAPAEKAAASVATKPSTASAAANGIASAASAAPSPQAPLPPVPPPSATAPAPTPPTVQAAKPEATSLTLAPSPASSTGAATPALPAASVDAKATPADAISAAPLVLPEPTDEFPPVPLAQVESVSKDLLEKAKQALTANNPGTAIRDLNHLLSLPTNGSTREAQELIGVAREKNNEIAKAKGEYELFLQLYPTGPDADRIRERLAKLPVILQQPGPSVAGGPLGQAKQPSWIITGGLSQYLYRGNSHIEIVTPPPPGLLTFNQQTLSLTDQNSLVTNLDLMATHRSEGTETRIVFRDSYNKNYLTAYNNPQQVSAAYIEQNNLTTGIQYRIGRQSGTFGAVGLFDGAYGSYQFRPGYRVSALAGELTQFGTTLVHQNFVGAGIEKQAKLDSVGGTAYFIQNRADGYVNREAVGLELRYFDAHKSAFSMVDYDVLFRGLNLVMAQGNYRLDSGTNFFLLTDHRRSPMLQLLSALPAAASSAPNYTPAINITEALLNTGVSLEDLRHWAADSTATSHLTSFGVTHPLTQKWQVGADFGFSSMSSIAGAGSVPAQPSTGLTKTGNFQVIGSGVVADADTIVANVTTIEAPTYTGRNLNLNIGNSWFDYRLRVDLGWRKYDQWDRDTSASLTRSSPTFRVSYRAFKDVTIEAETGREKSHQVDATGSSTDSLRKYLYTGYRWSWF